MKIIIALLLCLLGVGCSSNNNGGNQNPSPQPTTITIPDIMTYFVQSQQSGNGVALGWSDPWLYKRYDFGHYQVEQSYLRVDGVSAQTIWSYPPFGSFVAADGDGGEIYVQSPTGGEAGATYISETQDGVAPGIQQFGLNWWVADQYIPPCVSGWQTSPDGLGRACEATVTYPNDTGGTIIADTIVSEHYDLPGLGGKMERAYYGKGWGRLAWQAWGPSCPAQLDPARKPPMSYDGPPAELPMWVQCDSRIVTNIVPADGSLSGANFGWPP